MRTPNRRSTINRRPGNFLSAGCSLCAVRATPWKPGGREIRRGAPLAPTAARKRLWIEIRLDQLAIEMPGGVAEQRDHHGGEAKEERQRSRHQQHRDDQSPCRHRCRISRNGAERRHHRIAGAGTTVAHQRERNHADTQRDHSPELSPELRPALAIAFETVKVRIRSGAAASQDKALFNPLHTIFKFTGSKQ